MLGVARRGQKELKKITNLDGVYAHEIKSLKQSAVVESVRVALSCGACLVGPTRKTMQSSEDLQLETYILFGELTTY